jgi:hypothetical protein
VDKVLYNIREILKENLDKSFDVRRIEVGTLKDAFDGIITSKELPAIIISPNGEENMESQIANMTSIKYNVLFYIIGKTRNPNQLRFNERENLKPVLSQISNEIRRLFGEDKKLNYADTSAVRRWSDEWIVKDLVDNSGNVFREIKTHWIDDFIPWSGGVNDQDNLIPKSNKEPSELVLF